MNRRRNNSTNSGNAFVIAVLILCMAICTGGGVYYVYLKNCQINVARETEKVKSNIAEYERDIIIARSRIGDLQNRFVIREQLRQFGSSLQPITASMVEVVDPAPQADRDVASVRP